MEAIFLGIHVFSATVLIIVILTQRSEGGALSGLGGGNPTAGVVSTRGRANILTRTTAILAVIFMCSGLLLASVSFKDRNVDSIIKRIEQPTKADVPLAE